MELDEGLDDLRALLAESAPAGKKSKSTLDFYKSRDEENAARPNRVMIIGQSVAVEPVTTKLAEPAPDSLDYDQHVRALAFDRRAKPKDRTKTEEETIREEAERLREAEQSRLKRMRGEESDEEEQKGNKRRRKGDKGKERAPEGDDLDDDFGLDDDEGDAAAFGLGQGIGGPKTEMVNLGTDSEAGSEEDDEVEGSNDEEGSDDEDEDEEDLSDEDEEVDELASDLEEDAEAEELDDDSVDDTASPVAARKALAFDIKVPSGQRKELPFTFPCPEDYEQFLDIIEGLDVPEVETVVKRIRTLHHPSLGEGNKERLQGFLGVLLDHVLAASASYDSFALVASLTPHISALVALNPLTAAELFKEILKEMHETFVENISKTSARNTNSTFPDMGELAILRLIGLLWSTSDFSHPVSAPATLYMGQHLVQGRVRRLGDVAAGLFMVALFLQVSI